MLLKRVSLRACSLAIALGRLPLADAAPLAYITNIASHSVSVVDSETRQVIASVPVSPLPYGIAVNLAVPRAYTSHQSQGLVDVIDTVNLTVVATISVPGAFGLAANSTGTKLYAVSRSFSPGVYIIDTLTNGSVYVPFGTDPIGVVVANGAAYVTDAASGTVGVIDGLSNQLVTAVPVGIQPAGIATTPSGDFVYVANSHGPDTTNPATVSEIDTSTNTVSATIVVGAYPLSLAVHPDGSKLYVSNNGAGSVSVVDLNSHLVTNTIGVSSPWGISVTPDRKSVYVVSEDQDAVAVVDVQTNAVVATIPVGDQPIAFGDFFQRTPEPVLVPGHIVKIGSGLLRFVAKPTTSGARFALPSTNPALHGGNLRVFDTGGSAGDDTYQLPAGSADRFGWRGIGNPAGAKGYKYKGAGTPSDPCKTVLVKEKVIKAVCRDAGVTLIPPFTGNVGIALSVGTTERYCAQFGGDELRNDTTLTHRKNAPAPVACP
jgi:YVTN family beta-propeller protein